MPFDQPLTYRPWVPKKGYEREFSALKMLYGENVETWPSHLRDGSAERGEALPLIVDRMCAEASVYWLRPSQLGIITKIS